MLPQLILLQQAEFVKDKSINENSLSAQGVVMGIRKMNKLANVVIKVDIAKPYDMFSWLFLTKILRKFSFSEILIGFSLLGLPHLLWQEKKYLCY